MNNDKPIKIGSFYITKKNDNSKIFMRVDNLHVSKILCHVNINPKEGYTPHFHIVADNGSFESCICIEEATYFNHEDHHEFLNNSDLKEIDTFMRKECKSSLNGATTNWEQTAMIWNYANPDHQCTKVKDMQGNFLPQPDYTKTSGNKFINYGKGANKKKK